MKITKIEKKKRLYLLELDTEDKLYVTEDTLVRFMLSKDKVITEEELGDIQTFAQFSHGKNLALYHLSFKQRTSKEVRDYLAKHELKERIVEEVIASLKADRWLDDRQYAQAFIEQNSLSGDKGPYVLQQKLGQKGLSSSLVEEVLSGQDFLPLAQKVAEKAQGKYQGKLTSRGLQDKLTQHLINKGFSYQMAKEALQCLDLEKDEAGEQELLAKELDKQYRKYSKKYEGYDLKQRLTRALARKGYDYGDIASALRDYL